MWLVVQCGRGYSKDSVVVLNGSEEEVKQQREVMEQRRLEAKQAKQAAKASLVYMVTIIMGMLTMGPHNEC